MNGDVGYRTACCLLSKRSHSERGRDIILLVERQPGRARSLINARAVQGMLESMAADLLRSRRQPRRALSGYRAAIAASRRSPSAEPGQHVGRHRSLPTRGCRSGTSRCWVGQPHLAGKARS